MNKNTTTMNTRFELIDTEVQVKYHLDLPMMKELYNFITEKLEVPEKYPRVKQLMILLEDNVVSVTEHKTLEDCTGITVEGWGRVDLWVLDYSDITDHKVHCVVDGLWDIEFYLPEDFYNHQELKVVMTVNSSETDVPKEDMDGKILCFDEESTRILKEDVITSLGW